MCQKYLQRLRLNQPVPDRQYHIFHNKFLLFLNPISTSKDRPKCQSEVCKILIFSLHSAHLIMGTLFPKLKR